MKNIVTVDSGVKGADGENIKYSYDSEMKIKSSNDSIAYYMNQIGAIEAKIYPKKYGTIVFYDLIPVVTTDPEYADTYTYFCYDGVTLGKFLGSNAKDLPESTITLKESTARMYYGGNNYDYSIDELRKSIAVRLPLDTTKASMSMRGFQEHAQKVAFFGDSERGITGLFNNGNVPVSNSAVNWATATGDEIANDISTFMYSIMENSKNNHKPNILLIPPSRWAFLLRPMSSNSNMTILEYVKTNNPYSAMTNSELTIKQVFQLDEAGTGGVPRMMAYELNEDNLTMRMPISWRALAPQPVGLGINVPCEYKFGGVVYRFPLSAAYRDFTA